MNKKVIIMLVLLGIVLSVGLYFYAVRISNNKPLPAPIPVGYEKAPFSKKLEPINCHTLLEPISCRSKAAN